MCLVDLEFIRRYPAQIASFLKSSPLHSTDHPLLCPHHACYVLLPVTSWLAHQNCLMLSVAVKLSPRNSLGSHRQEAQAHQQWKLPKHRTVWRAGGWGQEGVVCFSFLCLPESSYCCCWSRQMSLCGFRVGGRAGVWGLKVASRLLPPMESGSLISAWVLLAVWPWVSPCISLGVSFPICMAPDASAAPSWPPAFHDWLSTLAWNTSYMPGMCWTQILNKIYNASAFVEITVWWTRH